MVLLFFQANLNPGFLFTAGDDFHVIYFILFNFSYLAGGNKSHVERLTEQLSLPGHE